MTFDRSRRRFVTLAAAAAAAPLVLRTLSAQAADLPKLTPADPAAKALAYTEDAAAVKHPAFKPGSHCANCNFYKGAAGAAYGPCQLFPKNSVAAKGWCSAWAKKV
ncbi:high-potential iron-sulfur protein [Thermomonas sp. S9]|uniref:high-potential iron-sulfur protein n=1 Tax=Thermomonas sp. S9 TaxID=2885203 RepID=UPI00216AF4CC|nr:high-potential iron-sulfur protein [Thermomonas sp. S9]MCR6496597.1 high-potential iron-sulfur protein [Thermomonas sp. S9]